MAAVRRLKQLSRFSDTHNKFAEITRNLPYELRQGQSRLNLSAVSGRPSAVLLEPLQLAEISVALSQISNIL